MIRRPRADDLAGNRAIEAVNDIARAAAPSVEHAGNFGRFAFWSHAVPIGLIPAYGALHATWPGVFATLAGYGVFIAVWFTTMRKFWLAPHYADQARRRRAAIEPFGDSAAMRAELEAEWVRRERAR